MGWMGKGFSLTWRDGPCLLGPCCGLEDAQAGVIVSSADSAGTQAVCEGPSTGKQHEIGQAPDPPTDGRLIFLI